MVFNGSPLKLFPFSFLWLFMKFSTCLWFSLVWILYTHILCKGTSLVVQMVKRLPAMQETWVQSLGWEDLLEKEMATRSSILAWKIPWMEEPGGLQSVGSQRVRHDWVTSLFLSFLPFSNSAMPLSIFKVISIFLFTVVQVRNVGLMSSVRRWQWHPTPVPLPGKSHGRRSLAVCWLWGHTESHMTEVT